MRVGFIGLGMMGRGMARNILERGYSLSVMGHRNRAAVEDMLGRGATEAPSPEALARDCEMVLICVSGSPQVEEIIYGDRGILAAQKPGLTVVDTSTSRPDSSRRIAADLAKGGTDFADAPLTRGPDDAKAGRLVSLVGAELHVFERIEPVLRAYSETITHFGPVGAGSTAKLINNSITMGTCALLAEGMAVAAAMGVDQRALYGVLRNGAADSGSLRKLVPDFLDGDLTGHKFAIANARKDIGYYRDLVEGLDFKCSLSPATDGVYQQAVDLGLGDRLMASLMEMHEMLNGIQVVPRRKSKK
ncbi:MAG: NAD(P)-dependent oxidoreductase [Rhodospirillales bacterium]|nr:NAD(P)-dependent oxidoreductase [Rhodospirillales bacterium]